MNVIVFTLRKGGSGKSTLAAHLAAQTHRSHSVWLTDTDPQGSLTLWHKLPGSGGPPPRSATEPVAHRVRAARRAGYGWVFIDTPPNMSTVVANAIRAATLAMGPMARRRQQGAAQDGEEGASPGRFAALDALSLKQ